ncbi:extracellular tyrosine-protein kinase PKDCC-like [Glandiceps talaboti]
MACLGLWKYASIKRLFQRRLICMLCLCFVLLLIFSGNIFVLSPQETSTFEEYRIWSTDRFPGHSAVEFEARLTKHIGDLHTDLKKHQNEVNQYENLLKQLHVHPLEPNLRHLMDTEYDLKANSFHGQNGNEKSKKQYPGLSVSSILSAKRHLTLGCESLANVSNREPIGIGYTKYVEKGDYNGEKLAIKSVALNGHDMNECTQKYMSYSDCLKLANYKLLKEITLLTQLQHTSIIQVSGYCINDATDKVTIMTELGSPVNILSLLQQSWEDRFRICLGVSLLVDHFASSPMGSLAIHDFKLAQFVRVDGKIKLADVDDVDNDEPTCKTSQDCVEMMASKSSKQVQITCVNKRCDGFNEKLNIYNTYKFFLSYLLPFEVPGSIQPMVDEVLNKTGSFEWNAATLRYEMEKILEFYKSGEYLGVQNERKSNKPGYRVLAGRDLSGKYDYRCMMSHSGDNCMLSAFNEQEAEDMCSSDKECRAFVVTSKKTWTGRTVVFLKNNFRDPTPSEDTTLYIRIT